MLRKLRYLVGAILVVIVLLFGVPTGLHYFKTGQNYLKSSDFKILKAASVDSNVSLADQNTSTGHILKVNKNKPSFSDADLSMDNGSWQKFSPLDSLNRAGVANAMLGPDLMPKAKRQPLIWNPTGWHNKKIGDKSDSGWLYDRSHLIGYQLTGENNNPMNLITGTRMMNTPVMETFENQIAKYIRTTKHHVRYRVTPIFKGDELVARSVQMEAQSIEDRSVSFNILAMNTQDGVTIDYATGLSTENPF